MARQRNPQLPFLISGALILVIGVVWFASSSIMESRDASPQFFTTEELSNQVMPLQQELNDVLQDANLKEDWEISVVSVASCETCIAELSIQIFPTQEKAEIAAVDNGSETPQISVPFPEELYLPILYPSVKLASDLRVPLGVEGLPTAVEGNHIVQHVSTSFDGALFYQLFRKPGHIVVKSSHSVTIHTENFKRNKTSVDSLLKKP